MLQMIKSLKLAMNQESGRTLHDAPGVEATSHPLPFGLHHRVAANYRKGNALLVGRTERIIKLKQERV